MQRICTGFMGFVVVAVMLLACSSPAPPEQQTADTPAAKQPPQTETQKPEAKIGDTPEGLIALIEDKKADPEKRQENFDLLKKQYPKEALVFARKKAEEYSSTNRDLLLRMGMGARRGVPDKEAEGDYEIGTRSVTFVMQNEIEKYSTPAEKAKYLIRTGLSKGWTGGMPSPQSFCDDVKESDKSDFTPGEEGVFVSLCRDSCDKDCLEKTWNRHESDWSSAAIALKKSLIITNCKRYRECNVNAFLQRLSEPDDPENDAHMSIIHFLVQWPGAHCIPYEDMMKEAESIGNTRFIEALIRFEQKYRSKQSGNCDKQHKPIPRQRGN